MSVIKTKATSLYFELYSRLFYNLHFYECTSVQIFVFLGFLYLFVLIYIHILTIKYHILFQISLVMLSVISKATQL
jgi:hypothetical protein